MKIPHYSFSGFPFLVDHEGLPGSKPPWGTLNCIDLSSGKIKWKRPLGSYPELEDFDNGEAFGAQSFGGPVIASSGVIFCGGTPNEKFYAFDAETGEKLWGRYTALWWIHSADIIYT